MITYTELVKGVAANLQIDATGDDITRLQVAENLNRAQLTLLTVLPVFWLDNAVKTARSKLISGRSDYRFPSDFLRFVGLWLDYEQPVTDGNPGRKAAVFDDGMGFYVNPARVATKRFPYVDLNVEGGYRIYPVPDRDVRDGIRLRYVWRLPDISENQPCLLEDKLKNLLVFRASALCAAVDNYSPELADRYGGLFREELRAFLPDGEKGR